ncbi:hypothetical protein O181_081532 [Austropuccinia psidii MF-1]|uniref:Uncharacterized protein n=1 Tax=Austropuccinia psidii MF-1 TaxID=1389203 RepID=A0A9Q3FQX0_9BASI|nr:hypothetical protein [Austropuccinia psidii MF-1]
MVHTRNGSHYSVQPDGSGQGRSKTRAISCNSSSQKTFLEDARSPPNSPWYLPKKFDVNSEPELDQCIILKAEPSLSGSHRNILVPVQKQVHSNQGRGVVNIFKPLEGAIDSYLHIKSFLGQEKTIEILGGWSPLSCKYKVKKIKNLLKNQSLLSIDQKKELEMTPPLEKEGLVASISSRNFQRQAKNTSEEAGMPQEPSGKG